MWHPMWSWDGSYGFGWAMFGLMHVLWWVILIAVVVVVLRALTGTGSGRWRRHDTALDILRERYARGEIDAAEFEERKKQLGR